MPSLDLKFLYNIKIHLTILSLSNLVSNLNCKFLSQIAKDFEMIFGALQLKFCVG